MQPGGGESNENIAFPDAGAVQEARTLHHAHDEARQVVLADGVEARHLRRLATEERAGILPAGDGHAANHLLRDVLVQHPGREVVQEEERPRALHQDVVHAVVHQALAHRVVPIRRERDLELGAHPVGARHQHRGVHAGRNGVQAPEGAQLGQGVLVASRRDQRLQAFLRALGHLEIDAGIPVTQTVRHVPPQPTCAFRKP